MTTQRNSKLLNLEEICLRTITKAGLAKSLAIEAINDCKNNSYKLCQEKLRACKKNYIAAQQIHHEILAKAASNEKINISFLLIHAEDQLMNAETTANLAYEIIDIHRRIQKLSCQGNSSDV